MHFLVKSVVFLDQWQLPALPMNSIHTGTIIPGKNSICLGGAKMAEIDV